MAAQASGTRGDLRRWGPEAAVVSSFGLQSRTRWAVKAPVTMWYASLFWSSRSHTDHVCRSRHAAVRDTEQLPGLPGNELKPAFPSPVPLRHHQHQRPWEQHRESRPQKGREEVLHGASFRNRRFCCPSARLIWKVAGSRWIHKQFPGTLSWGRMFAEIPK